MLILSQPVQARLTVNSDLWLTWTWASPAGNCSPKWFASWRFSCLGTASKQRHRRRVGGSGAEGKRRGGRREKGKRKRIIASGHRRTGHGNIDNGRVTRHTLTRARARTDFGHHSDQRVMTACAADKRTERVERWAVTSDCGSPCHYRWHRAPTHRTALCYRVRCIILYIYIYRICI